MTGAVHGFGVVVKRLSAPDTYTSMGELADISIPTLTREVKDATHHGSPDGYREYMPALRDGGEATLTLHYPVGGLHAAGAMTDFAANAANDYQIIMPGAVGETVDFTGLITEISPASPLDDKMVYTVKIKSSGKPVWAATA